MAAPGYTARGVRLGLRALIRRTRLAHRPAEGHGPVALSVCRITDGRRARSRSTGCCCPPRAGHGGERAPRRRMVRKKVTDRGVVRGRQDRDADQGQQAQRSTPPTTCAIVRLRRITACPAAVAQDLQTQNPSVASARAAGSVCPVSQDLLTHDLVDNGAPARDRFLTDAEFRRLG